MGGGPHPDEPDQQRRGSSHSNPTGVNLDSVQPAPARPTMKHAHAAEATLPSPRPLTERQPIRTSQGSDPLLIHDLLLDFDELRLLLAGELERRRWLDAFLLAAGMNQILEDHLHRDFPALDRIGKTLAGV